MSHVRKQMIIIWLDHVRSSQLSLLLSSLETPDSSTATKTRNLDKNTPLTSLDLHTRGYWDLKLTHKVGFFFFSAIVNGLTNYVIRHPILIRKYDIITMPPFPETMHKHRKPIFWAPGWVPHKLDDTILQVNVSDRLLLKIESSTYPSCLTVGLFALQHQAWGQVCWSR